MENKPLAAATAHLPEQKQPSDLTTPGATNSHFSALTLHPVGARTGSELLASCLTLVAPTGMTADERRTWLKVARETLKGIPEDLLQRGAAYARLHADHPAKIIPLIMREIEGAWETRKRVAREDTRRTATDVPALSAPQVGGVPHEVTQAILKEVGLNLRTDEAKQ